MPELDARKYDCYFSTPTSNNFPFFQFIFKIERKENLVVTRLQALPHLVWFGTEAVFG